MQYAPDQVKQFMQLYHKVMGTERDSKELAFCSDDGISVIIKYEEALKLPVELRDEIYKRILGIMEEAIKLRKKN